MQKGRLSKLVRLNGASVLFCASLLSQPTASEEVAIFGKAIDTQGRPVTEVAVVLESRDADFRQTTKTDWRGRYSFSCLPDASYRLSFQAPGYLLQQVENLRYAYPRTVMVQQVLNIDADALRTWTGSLLVVRVRRSDNDQAIPQAEVEVSRAGQTVFVKQADDCGRTHFALPSGAFEVEVRQPGFRRRSRQVNLSGSLLTLLVELAPQKSDQKEGKGRMKWP